MQEIEEEETNTVKLTAALATASNQTKAPLDSKTNEPLNIGLARIDQGDVDYPYFNSVTSQIPATLNPGSSFLNQRPIEFDKNFPQKFVDASSKIKYASWYPYSASNFNNGVITQNIDGDTDLLYGSVATGDMHNSFNIIRFDHALVKYTIKVYAMLKENETNSESIWGKLNSVTIKGLPNQCILTLPKKENNIDPEDPTKNTELYDIKYIGQNKNNILSAKYQNKKDLNITLPVGKANALTLDAVIAAPPSDNILDVYVGTTKGNVDGQPTYQSLSIARNFQKGRNYEIFLRFSDNGLINAEISVGAWTDGGTIENETINNEIYYDLSSAEKANCYIVTSANYSYCFDVTTKGNGVNGLVDDSGLSLEPNYIDVLWMDEQLLPYFHLDNHHPIQNRAMFHITNDKSNKSIEENKKDPTIEVDKSDKSLSTEGNVLIGVYNNDPVLGKKLLWTWHIWLSDKPGNQAYKNGFVALDRDLGAISPRISPTKPIYTSIDGLYYQWGRPTPLPLGRTVVNTNSTPFTVSPDQSQNIDLTQRITNPDKFYTERLLHSNFNGLWGYVEPTTPYTKTIYDPCPPGYRIPSRQMYSYIQDMEITRKPHSFESTIDSYDTLVSPISGYYTWESGNQLKQVNYQLDEKSPGGSYLWSGTPNMKNQSYMLSCFDNATNKIQSGQSKVGEPSNALPIRCVSVRSKPEIINLSAYQTANSYIVSRKGFYQFKVDVRGNGVDKLIAIGGKGTKDVSEGLKTYIGNDISKITYLWWQGAPGEKEVNGQPEIPIKIVSDGKITDGYAFFSVTNWKPGNLIVAGWNSKGTEILWTWHLWLTEEPQIHESCAYAVMDRYLGATSIPRPTIQNPDNTNTIKGISDIDALGSMGLFYQFGRKDPFPRPGAIKNSTDGTQNVGKWWKYDRTKKKWIPKTGGLESTTNVDAEKSIPNSVKNPTKYFLATDNKMFSNGKNFAGPIPEELNHTDNNNGNLTAVDQLGNACFNTWKRFDDRGGVWGFNAFETSFAVTGSKSMYDPCPPGYSVPYYLVWSYPVNAKVMVLTNLEGDINTNPPVIKNDYGIILKRNVKVSLPNSQKLNATFDQTWYPYTGYLHGSNGKLYECGSVGRFQSTSMAGKASGRSIFYKKIDANTVHTGQAVATNPATGLPTSFGFPVRCVKE